MLSKKQAQKLYALLTGEKQPTLKEFIKKIVPNTKQYQGKILVRLFYVFDDTTFQSVELMEKKEFSKLKPSTKISLGKVNGPFEDIVLPLEDILIDQFEDPFEIWNYVEKYSDFVITNGYLTKVAEKIK